MRKDSEIMNTAPFIFLKKTPNYFSLIKKKIILILREDFKVMKIFMSATLIKQNGNGKHPNLLLVKLTPKTPKQFFQSMHHTIKW